MKGPKVASVGAKKKNLGLSMKHDGGKKAGNKSKVGSLKNIEVGVKQLKKNASGLAEVVSMPDTVMGSLNGKKKSIKSKMSPQVKMGLKIDALIKQKVESGKMPSLPTSPSSPEVTKNLKKQRNRKNSKSNEDQSNLESSSPEVVKSKRKRRHRNKSTSPDTGKGGSPTLQKEVSTEASGKKNKRPRKLSTSSGAKESEQPSTVSESTETPGRKKLKRRRVRRKSKSQSTAQESEKSPTPEGGKRRSRKRSGSRPKSGGSPPKRMVPIKLEPEPVLKAVDALMTHINSKKSTTLLDEPEPIFVQLCFNGVPITPKHLFRLKLKHSLVLDTTDVCLIVKDEKKDPDETVLYFTDLLSKLDIKVSEIIPMKTLKSEYSQFEEKRKLCERFDIFLCDTRINVMSFLGKKFQEKHKAPYPVELNEKKAQESINSALKKSLLMLNSFGSESSVQAGWHVMEKEEICDNIISLVDDVQSMIPAIIPLIQKVSIKSQKSPSFELFMSLCPPPISKKVLGTAARPKPVVGELSIQDGRDVVVHPTGEVQFKDETGSSKKKRNRSRRRRSSKNVPELSSTDEGNSPKKGETLAVSLNGLAKSSPRASNKTNSQPEVTSPKKKKAPKTKKVVELTPSKNTEGDFDPLVWKKGDPSPKVKKLEKPLAGGKNANQVNPRLKAKVNPSPKAKSPKKKQKANSKRTG